MGKNKTGKYIKYAIGEIILVVIGILIALQINNWNENRKKNILKSSYTQLLKSDLKSDVILLSTEIGRMEKEITKLNSFSSRLSSPSASIDTIIKIARYEFLPFADPSINLNRNTYNSLMSTGRIDLFESSLNNELQEHNTVQLRAIQTISFNNQLYADLANAYRIKFPFNSPFNAIKGSLMNSVWNKEDPNIIKSNFNGILTAKIAMLKINISVRKSLLEKTATFLETIESVN
jgi:hypothetical protein